MTIEEAIKDIKENIKPIVGGISLNMAVEALDYLKQSRVEPCCEVSMDYEDGYHRIQELYKEALQENEDLKKALIRIALRL